MIMAITESDIERIIEGLNRDNRQDLRIAKMNKESCPEGGRELIYQLKHSVYGGRKKSGKFGEFRLYGTETTMDNICQSMDVNDFHYGPGIGHYKSGGKLYREIVAVFDIGCVNSEWRDDADDFFGVLDSFEKQEKIGGYPIVIKKNCKGGEKYILRDVIDQDGIALGGIGGRIRNIYITGRKLMRKREYLESSTSGGRGVKAPKWAR